MSRSLLLLIAAIAAAPAAAQIGFNPTPAGPIDIDQLKQHTLSQVLPAAGVGRFIGGLPADPAPTTWGLRFDAMPELYQRLPELQDRSGLYISEVVPGSPAEKAGLVKGLVVLELNGQAVTESRSLGYLHQPAELTLLTAKGVQRVTVQPRFRVHHTRPGNFSFGNLETQGNVVRGRSVSSFSNAQPGSSVAVSMVNGAYAIEASVPTKNGQQKVQLSGSRAEVEAQLAKLPTTVAEAIRSQM